MRTRKVRVLFSSQPVEVREKSVLVDVAGTITEMPNDWMWVFAGGEPPNAFLQKIGVSMGERDLTREAGEEASLALAARLAAPG